MQCVYCQREIAIPCDDWGEDICDECIEITIERCSQKREWYSCHDEPCPESELTPYPTTEGSSQ